MKDLTKILDAQIKTKKGNYKSSTSEPRFSPSSLGSPCLRKIFYNYMKVEQDFESPLSLNKMALLGDGLHELAAELLRNEGILIDYYDKNGDQVEDRHNPGQIDYEFPLVNKELQIKAKIDAVLKEDGKVWLAEFKSCGLFSFKKLEAPKEPHLIQGIIYLYLFNQALSMGDKGQYAHISELQGINKVEGIRFIYMCRDDLQLKEFVITQDDEIFKETITKMHLVKQYHPDSGHENSTKLPPKTKDWCNSCPYRKKCKENRRE